MATENLMVAAMLPQLTERTISRFWKSVAKADGCWEWTGSLNEHGYGILSVKGKRLRAHRLSYAISTGEEISSDLMVCHHCDNPKCVRPEHLFLGTQTDNMRDAVSKQRMRRGDSHGLRQHPESVHRGDSHPNAVLTESDVVTMRVRRDAGEKLTKIASDYGISLSAASLICNRRAWKHVKAAG